MLTKLIKNLIQENGPLSVAEFMQHVLFHPKHGYYQQQQPFGESGDFITSPEISQIFGEIIGSYAAYKWLENHQPKTFHIIELGPGNGSLMDDFLRATKNIPNFHKSLTINLVEISTKLKDIQKTRLTNYNIPIKHYDNFYDIPQTQSFIIANEFFDALPIYQFIRHQDKWCERMVGLNQDQLSFIIAGTPKDNIKNLITEPSPAKHHDIYELSLASMNIMDDIAKFINHTNSSAIIIDYGYVKKSYGDTLQALKQHKYHNIFDHLGEADLTAHVDFELFSKILSKYSKLNFDITTQRNFLLNLGILERTKQLSKNLSQAQKDKLENSTNRLIAQTQESPIQIDQLIDGKIPTKVDGISQTYQKNQMGELFKTLLIN